MGFLPFRQQALYAFEGFTLADGHARILRPRDPIARKAILRIARTRVLRLRSASTRSQGHIRAVGPRGL